MIQNFWRADEFFRHLTINNKLAAEHGFRFCRVSSLEGFEEALAAMQSTTAFICFSDTADGYTELNNSPRTRRVITIFMAIRHAIDDMKAREFCMDTMRELFRQFMSVLLIRRARLELNHIYIDPRISFSEIDRYFFSGCACAHFSIAIDKATDLRFNENEWLDNVTDCD